MTYWLTNVYSSLAVDWEGGFKLVQDFLKGFDSNLLIGFSFNRYSGQDYPHSKFEFRCNFSNDGEGKKEAERRLHAFKNEERIGSFDDWVYFQRRQDVVKSAEVSSSWSITFKEWLTSNPSMALSFFSNPTNRMQFLTRFIPIILQEYGVPASLLTSDIDDDYIDRLRRLSLDCKINCHYPFPTKPSLDFLERVIHFFINCILSGDIEEAFRFHLMWVTWLGDLCNG